MSSVGGRLSRMANQFLDLNGLNQWTDFWREGFARASSVHFGNQLKKSWKDLDQNFRNRMDEYGITQSDWKDLQGIGSFSLKKRFGDDPEFKSAIKELTDDEFVTPDWITENGGVMY